MYRNSILILIAVVSVLIVLALPLYLKFFIYPAYEELLIKNVEKEMKVLAREMIKGHQFLSKVSPDTPLPQSFIDSIEKIRLVVGLPKVKIFTTGGVIVYSTDSADIGNQTSKSFFPKMLADGEPRSEVKVFENTEQSGDVHLIETYIPIYENGAAIGAFEIYHNITGLKRTFDRMINEERKILLPIIILLLAASFTSSWLAYRSMAELKKTKDQFMQLSITDNLTGLLNRRGFAALIERQLAILNRFKKGALLLYIDMDEFKYINDKFGHASGDKALIAASEILKSTLRTADIIGRIGGDEFAALAVNGDADEQKIRERLQESLNRWNSLNGFGYKLSFSLGIIEIPPDSTLKIDELMDMADKKMYAEKQNNRSDKNVV